MELLISCDQSDNGVSLNFWRPESGTKVFNLRGPKAHPSTLSFIKDEGFAVIETGKPFIHFWQCGSNLQSSKRILCPGKPCSMTISPDGNYMAVALGEKICVWQVAAGKIVSVLSSSHYRPVSALKFNDNGTYLISGGEDGMVFVWNFIKIVSNSQNSPKYTWSDHSLSVTGLHVGRGGVKASVFTCSIDRTAKIYSLLTGNILISVSFPISLTSIVTDHAEFALYVGSTNGQIYKMNLHNPTRSLEQHISSDINSDFVFKRHKESISCLSISSDGKILASGDQEGQINLWDLETKQPIKNISLNSHASESSKITNLVFWLGNTENLMRIKKPSIIFPDVPKIVEIQDENKLNDRNQCINVYNNYKQKSHLNEKSGKPQSNFTEVSNLKVQLNKAENINRELHEYFVDNILNK